MKKELLTVTISGTLRYAETGSQLQLVEHTDHESQSKDSLAVNNDNS